MRPTRRSQPYRRGAGTRQPGGALSAMLRGATAFGGNPRDATRLAQKQARARRRGVLAAKLSAARRTVRPR